MAIPTKPTITNLPDAPQRTDLPQTFSNKADAFVAALQPFKVELIEAIDWHDLVFTETSSVYDATVVEKDAAIVAKDASVTAKNASEAARDKSQLWAEELEDVAVETGQFSSFHHSKKSEAFKDTAETAAAAAQAAAGLPALAGNARKSLTVNDAETGVEFKLAGLQIGQIILSPYTSNYSTFLKLDGSNILRSSYVDFTNYINSLNGSIYYEVGTETTDTVSFPANTAFNYHQASKYYSYDPVTQTYYTVRDYSVKSIGTSYSILAGNSLVYTTDFVNFTNAPAIPVPTFKDANPFSRCSVYNGVAVIYYDDYISQTEDEVGYDYAYSTDMFQTYYAVRRSSSQMRYWSYQVLANGGVISVDSRYLGVSFAPDGQTFSSQLSGGVDFGYSRYYYDGTNFIYVKEASLDTYSFQSTQNGTTWVDGVVPSTIQNSPFRVVYGNTGEYIISTNGLAYITTDMINFTLLTDSSVGTIIAYNATDGIYLTDSGYASKNLEEWVKVYSTQDNSGEFNQEGDNKNQNYDIAIGTYLRNFSTDTSVWKLRETILGEPTHPLHAYIKVEV